jgi:RNA polymerase sigma-70 factor (ECF subfamily)
MIPVIILAIEDSDDRAFMENIYISYQRLMYSEILKIVKDSWATEDILHTVIIKLIDKIPLLRTLTRTKLVNYIITASKNTALNFLRQKKRLAEYTYDDGFDSLDEDEVMYDVGSEFNLRERIDGVNTAWKLLDDRSKRILQMKYILEKTNEEIGQELGIKPDSVRTTIIRVREKLKNKMEETEMA